MQFSGSFGYLVDTGSYSEHITKQDPWLVAQEAKKLGLSPTLDEIFGTIGQVKVESPAGPISFSKFLQNTNLLHQTFCEWKQQVKCIKSTAN